MVILYLMLLEGEEMQKDIEPIKVLMEAYKEKYGAYPQL